MYGDARGGVVLGEGVLGARRLAWHHPEWWALGLAAGAWVALIAASAGALTNADAVHHQQHMAGIRTSMPMHVAHWQLMVLAMMLPTVVYSLRVAAFRSLWRRRHRAVAGFLVGYSAVWLLVGLAVSGLVTAVPRLTAAWQNEAVAAALILGAAWQCSPIKRGALRNCHRTFPLAARGWRADRDCLAFGWHTGCWCCVNCWPLMVACALSGHNLLAMFACGFIGIVERYSWRPNSAALGLYLLGFALVFGVSLA